MAQMLDSEQAARRLGVKPATLYAYVSRGLLTSYKDRGRRSLFAMEDVEALARRARGGRQVETKLASVTTAVTHLDRSGPAYRGRPATALATSASFEEVAELLWGVGPGPWRPHRLSAPEGLQAGDLLRWAVVMSGARDPLRFDLGPDAVTRAARRLIATMVAVLGPPHMGPPEGARGEQPLADQLAEALTDRPTPAVARAIDAALVLLADHELASSTLAARIAGSTRASLYDAVLAGLGTIGGSLHGAASRLAHLLLEDALRRGAEEAIEEVLRWRRSLPGFGQPLYPNGDPRAAVLLDLVEGLPGSPEHQVVRSVLGVAAAQQLPPPNIDMSLAALMLLAGARPGAGEVVFSVARTAGMVAHLLEEYSEQPLRFRARAVYTAAEIVSAADVAQGT